MGEVGQGARDGSGSFYDGRVGPSFGLRRLDAVRRVMMMFKILRSRSFEFVAEGGKINVSNVSRRWSEWILTDAVLLLT